MCHSDTLIGDPPEHQHSCAIPMPEWSRGWEIGAETAGDSHLFGWIPEREKAAVPVAADPTTSELGDKRERGVLSA